MKKGRNILISNISAAIAGAKSIEGALTGLENDDNFDTLDTSLVKGILDNSKRAQEQLAHILDKLKSQKDDNNDEKETTEQNDLIEEAKKTADKIIKDKKKKVGDYTKFKNESKR